MEAWESAVARYTNDAENTAARPLISLRTEPLPELQPDEHLRLERALGYLAGRDLTYKGKVIKKTFGTHNIAEETYEDFMDQLDTLVDAGVLENRWQKYAFSPDVDPSTLELDEFFDINRPGD